MSLEELKKKAEELAGYELDIDKTKDGKYIVLFMSLKETPPPKGATPEEALSLFIEWFEKRSKVNLPDPGPEVLPYEDGPL